MTIAGMTRRDFLSVFDRAPVLFGAPGNFRNVGQQSVRVRTIKAIHLLGGIEVAQFGTIKNQIFSAADFGNAVHRKTYCLIDGNEDVQQGEGYEACIDQRRTNKHKKPRMQNVMPKRSPQKPMFALFFPREVRYLSMGMNRTLVLLVASR
jgi:hypothetical protein